MKHFDIAAIAPGLAERGFAELPNSGMVHYIKHAHDGFWRMLDTDPLRKDFILDPKLFPIDPLGDPFEFGLIDKRGGKKKEAMRGTFDRVAGREREDAGKFMFQYSEEMLPLLSERAKQEYATFFRALSRFGKVALRLSLEVAEEFDQRNKRLPPALRFPGTFKQRFSSARSMIRLARYLPVDGKLPDAQVHCDRGCLTVHYYSSAPGLRVFDKNKVPQVMNETDPDTLCIFTGEKFRIVTRNRYGVAAAHGAHDERRKDGEAIDDNMRFVIVAFIHCALTPDDVLWFEQNESLFFLNQSEFAL